MLLEMGKKAKEASIILATLSTPAKNKILLKSAEALVENMDKILEANKKDVEAAKAVGVKNSKLLLS